MSNITVKFIGNEYSVPEDILTYIDLLDFTDNVQKQLASTFVRKLRNEIANDNIGLLGDEDLATEIEQQVGKYIAKLCDNGVYTRTISDYLKNNKGYQLYSEVNKTALEKMKSLLIREMDEWQAGYEQAVNKADSHVTGMGFSIWSSSFVNHAIYAAMEASTLNKQGKEAEAQYQKDMNDLRSRLNSRYGGEKSNYINNTYIPNMEAALTVFAYELLDKYVADLIANGKFDGKTLDYVDISRSNDLLKNLTLSNNKQAILENAFAACPYNIAVYMQAMKYDFLDYDSFQTAKIFKQDKLILSFLKESWGEVSYPTKFNINYHCIDIWALFTDKTSAELLFDLTDQYTTGIVKSYSKVADILKDKLRSRKIIGEFSEDIILSGNSICKSTACEYVKPIVATVIWEQLIEKCGHGNLFRYIKKLFPASEEKQTKKELDDYIIEQLANEFEEARKELVYQIEVRKAEEERLRIEQEKEKEEQERLKAQKREQRVAATKKGVKRALVVIGGMGIACIVLLIVGIIYLYVTDKPIDDDFSNKQEYNLHSLTYYVPEKWEYDLEQSYEQMHYYARYNNWGNFVGTMGIKYEGDITDTSVDEVVSIYQTTYKDATVTEKSIDEQNYDVVSYIDQIDGEKYYYNIYVTEKNSSVFFVYFMFEEENNKINVFEQIVQAIEFDEYVNPKEDAYNEALNLMDTENYEDAISVFMKLNGYRDSAELISKCQVEICDDKLLNAKELISKEKYYDAISILEELDDYGDSKQQLQIAKYGYANTLMDEGDFENASIIFEELDAYSSSKEMLAECIYMLAKNSIDAYQYDKAKEYLNQILDYKDAAQYGELLDNIVSNIYYNDEYRSLHFVWIVSRIDTNNCSRQLLMYTGQDNAPWDDEYVIDFSSSVFYEWKTVNSKNYMTTTGEPDDSYFVLEIDTNGKSLTEQSYNGDGTSNVADVYHILSEEYSELLKKNWIEYFEENEYDYWERDKWISAAVTVK